MAYDYNRTKQLYEGLNDEQKQQFDMQNKDNENYKSFMNQYNSEKQQAETPKVYNEQTWYYETPKKEESFNNNQNVKVSSDLDTSKFNAAPWQITVKEWTAKDTWKPDYQLSSEARLNEMKSNLDQYFKDSPWMFKDRETFNKVFEYNTRESEAQKQLLDSYWKRKEDIDKAANYTSGESILKGMNNAEITSDQLNYIKEYSPEAYREWQQKQEDEIKLRIINDIVPPLLKDISTQLTDMMNSLQIQPQDALQIEEAWTGMMEKTWAWQTMQKANDTVAKLEYWNDKKISIAREYANSTWWTVSDTLALARMNKALAPCNEAIQWLQYQYQDYANLYNQQLATANQAAAVRQMQAQENQRVWNQRLTALGFAMQASSYRTPEQQAQLQLQTQGLQNEMNLLYQSKANDLNLYNQYATAKLNNQLNSELTDLSVEDPAQLRSNLNNILSQYYANYWDIIKRSQSQAVDDILAYAKANWISVAEALTKNFIEPLQSKSEYKAKIRNSYNLWSKQSLTKIWDRDVILTQNADWSISFEYIDPEKEATFEDFLASKQDGQKGWQCWKFVNDYLEELGYGRLFTNDIADKREVCNIFDPADARVWDVVLFDYSDAPAWSTGISENSRKYWHVAIVKDIDRAAGTMTLAESNFDWKETISTTRKVRLDNPYLYGFLSVWSNGWASSSGDFWTFERNWNSYDLSKYSWWNDLTDDEKLTVENLLTYQTDPASLPKSWKDNWASNQRVRAAAAAIGRDNGYSERKYSLVKNAEKKWDDAALPWGVSSSNSTAMSILKSVSDSFNELWNYDINTVNSWINLFKKETWDPTVWALYTDMRVAASEIAKALKWWASATTEEIRDISNLLDGNMWEEQAKSVFEHFAKNLYEKNESEAMKFYKTTWYKPDSIWTDETSKRMVDHMGIDLWKYYNYEMPEKVTADDIRATYFQWQYSNQTATSTYDPNINFILHG